MKLEIMGFSQQGLMDLGLDNTDAVLLRWFVDYQGTQRMKAVPNPEDGKVYFWVNFRKLCEDLPIITQSDRWMARRFDKLVSAGVLAKYSAVGPIGKFSAFRIGDGDQYMTLVEAMSVNTAAMSVKSNMADTNSDLAMSPASDMQSNLNRLPSNNNTGDSPQGDKPACAPACAREKTGSVEEFLGDDRELRDTFRAFIEMRVKQRKPLTDYAKALLVKRLRTLATDRQGWIAILNQSIENSWQSVYPLHSDRGGSGSGKPARTQISNAAHDGLQGGEIVW